MKIRLLPLFAAMLFTCACSKGQKALEEEPGSGIDPETEIAAPANDSPLKNHLGINGFEWDFLDNNAINPAKMENIRSFGVFRHYLDWERLEATEGSYTFNPTNSGGWNYDLIYAQCKADGIDVLSCIKVAPKWLIDTYPAGSRDPDNVPAKYGLSRTDPASYVEQARVGFQFAARYGHNTAVDPTLVKVNSTPRWTNDPVNTVKIGLGYINYVECDNERDKTWKGPLAEQNPEEYAANMSAFYDGNMGKLGKNAGVKTADPNMKVVMGGLSSGDVNYVIRMIEWCRKNRGLKADGSVNLCFDVINYHLYSNDFNKSTGTSTIGQAPELSKSAEMADAFVAMSKKYANGMDVWITEAGYDVNQGSPTRAYPIGQKSTLITQADWMLRSTFLYIRHGLKRSFFYMLDDVNIGDPTQYSSSGFVTETSGKPLRRPVANYFYQTKKLMGDFQFSKTISADPMVDVYVLGKRTIYVLFVPSDKGSSKAYQLDLGSAASAKIYTLVPGENATADNMPKDMSVQTVQTVNGKLNVTVTETPVFVEKI